MCKTPGSRIGSENEFSTWKAQVVSDTGGVLHPVSGTQQRHDDGSRGDPLRKGGKFNAAAEEQTSHTKQPLHSTVPCPRIF